MAEPTTTVLAVAGATTSTLAVAATALGVPAPVVIAAIVGATAAVVQAERADLTLRVVVTLLVTFAVAMSLGIWVGRVAGHAVVGFLNSLPLQLGMSADYADPAAAVLVAMLGQSRLLPLGLSLLQKKAEATQ